MDNNHNNKLHSIEDHNYWIKRNGKCPYCMSGSKPIEHNLIVDGVNK